MIITKNGLQHIVDAMPEKADIAYVFDQILLHAKIEQAIKESENGEGMEWEEVKKEMKKR
jgi:hypothetical protein